MSGCAEVESSSLETASKNAKGNSSAYGSGLAPAAVPQLAPHFVSRLASTRPRECDMTSGCPWALVPGT